MSFSISLFKTLMGISLKATFTEYYFANYQPLVLLTYAAEYNFFELNPNGYHIINLIFHALNSVLVLLLIYLITENAQISFLLALIFSLHPMQTESIAWVSALKELMCAFFYILSFISYIKYSKDGKQGFYILSIILFICALLSKPMAITLPIIFILYDYYKDDLSSAKIIEKLPILTISGLFVRITFSAQESGGAMRLAHIHNVVSDFFYAFYNIAFYIAKLILPLNLSAHYAYPERFSFASKEFVIALLVIAALISYLINFKKIKREINFGIASFLVGIVPILRFTPLGDTIAADRYMYIPIISFSFAIVMFLKPILSNVKNAKKIVIVITSAYLLFFGAISFTRADIWRDNFTYWENVLKTSPNYNNALLSMGYYYLEENRNTKKSREYFIKVINDKDDNKKKPLCITWGCLICMKKI